MAFDVHMGASLVTIELTGWDRLMCWRRRVEIDIDAVRAVSIENRSVLEALIDHRALGTGTHNGSKRPGRRRVGTMLGRGVAGKQFWAVGRGDARLVVLDLVGHEFHRAVLHVDVPRSFQRWVVEASASTLG